MGHKGVRHGKRCKCEGCVLYFRAQAQVQAARAHEAELLGRLAESERGTAGMLRCCSPESQALIEGSLRDMREAIGQVSAQVRKMEALFDVLQLPENPKPAPRIDEYFPRPRKPPLCKSRNHGECRCVRGTKHFLCFVHCPWCGYNVNTSNPCAWCAGCYCLFWVDTERSVVHFGKGLPKSQAVCWAIAIAKMGGMKMAEVRLVDADGKPRAESELTTTDSTQDER